MKRFLSSLLCAILLLGLLPLAGAPARMKIGDNPYIEAIKTTAKVGDVLYFSVFGEDTYTGYSNILYSWNILVGTHFEYPLSGYGQYSLDYIPREPGTYYAGVDLEDRFDKDWDFVWSPAVVVSFRPAPKITTVEALGGTSLKITWNKTIGATGYWVERSTSRTTGYKLVKTTTATSFTNTYLKAGTRYYYRVRAYNIGITEKWPSSEYSAPVCGVPLAKSAIVSATGVSRTQVKLTWKKITGATGYQILRSATPGGVYKSIKLTTALTYTAGGMQHAKTYYFKVRPYKQFGTVRYYGPLSGYRSGRTR